MACGAAGAKQVRKRLGTALIHLSALHLRLSRAVARHVHGVPGIHQGSQCSFYTLPAPAEQTQRDQRGDDQEQQHDQHDDERMDPFPGRRFDVRSWTH